MQQQRQRQQQQQRQQIPTSMLQRPKQRPQQQPHRLLLQHHQQTEEQPQGQSRGYQINQQAFTEVFLAAPLLSPLPYQSQGFGLGAVQAQTEAPPPQRQQQQQQQQEQQQEEKGGAAAAMVEARRQKRVQTFGRKKNAVAVALCTEGKGLLRVNGAPLHLLKPEALRVKACESILILGKERFEGIDIRVRVRGGGYVSQVYAIRQAIAKGVVAFHQKYVDEATKREIRDTLVACDRSLVVADPRRCEPKKFGGPGARARYQKSYR